MMLFALAALLAAFVLLVLGRAWLAWVVPGALLFAGWWTSEPSHPFLFLFGAGLFALLAAITGVPSVRRELLTARILPLIAPILPRMSETEKVAIEAGPVGWEAEFYTGNPSWRKLLAFQPQELSPKEQAFLDGPCGAGCCASCRSRWRRHGSPRDRNGRSPRSSARCRPPPSGSSGRR
jgi:acyl-CoA dehydrogenase